MHKYTRKILSMFVLLLTTMQFVGADSICHGNICVDGNGDISMQNNSLYADIVDRFTETKKSEEDINNNSIFEPTGSSSITGNNELEKAIHWGYQNKLTQYNDIDSYNAEYALLREDSAKLLYQAARTLGYVGKPSTNCMFSDIDDVSESLQENIANICKDGELMKGDDGKFFPFRELTKAEAITIIARITGIKDTTSTSAWWTPYLEYTKKLNIFQEADQINETTMDNKISRGDLIVLLFRLGMLYDEHYGDFSSVINDPSNLPTGESSSEISIGAGIDTPRFTNALLWMYNNTMTNYWRPADYNPYRILTKEQAAKLLSVYYDHYITSTKDSVICNYQDIDDSTLKEYIINLCRHSVFPNESMFHPTEQMKKDLFVEALLVMQGTLPTDSNEKTIIKEALAAELITTNDLSTFDRPLTRYEAAIMLHNLYLKNTFIDSLNDSDSTYYVIAPSTQETNTGSNQKTQHSFIDIATIDSKDFDNGYVSLFGDVFKITKKETIKYFPTSYSRYGNIIDPNTDRKIGSIILAIGQKSGTKVIVEGYIVLEEYDNIYIINPSETIPYYSIEQIKK